MPSSNDTATIPSCPQPWSLPPPSAVIFGILWALRKKAYVPGAIFWLYLALAGLARLVVEFWRVNSVLALGLTEAQWFSLLMIIIGTWQWMRAGRETKVATT